MDHPVFPVIVPDAAVVNAAQVAGTGDEALIFEAVTRYRERFADGGMFENRPYPGVKTLLASLQRAGHRLFVATAKPTIFAKRVIEHFELSPYFEAIYGAELDGTRSRKKDLIAFMLKSEGLVAGDCVMIGDRDQDMIGASANGVARIGVLWGYGSEKELRKAGAQALVRNWEDLASAIESL